MKAQWAWTVAAYKAAESWTPPSWPPAPVFPTCVLPLCFHLAPQAAPPWDSGLRRSMMQEGDKSAGCHRGTLEPPRTQAGQPGMSCHHPLLPSFLALRGVQPRRKPALGGRGSVSKDQVYVRDGSRLLRTHSSEHTGRPGPRSQVRKPAQAPVPPWPPWLRQPQDRRCLCWCLWAGGEGRLLVLLRENLGLPSQGGSEAASPRKVTLLGDLVSTGF